MAARVIIVGAGPVGAILALALARRSVPVLLIESLLRPEIECRAASCHPPTIAMLEDLGLLEAGLEQGLVSPVFKYLDRPSGQLIATFDLGAMKNPPRHPFVLQWEQYKIVNTVVDILKTLPLVEVWQGARVTGLRQTGDKVTLTVSRGEVEREGEGDEVEGDYVVGCDGGRSTIRGLAGFEFEGFTWAERFLKIDTLFEFPEIRSDLSNRNYFADPERWLNLFKARGPDGGGMWRAVSPTLPDQTDEELLSPEAIETRLQLFCPKPGTYDIATVALYKVHQRVATSFNRGRVLLAGDAAHINNPIGGMGMNGGIHDAVDLAEKLQAIFTGAAADPLLDRYSRQRRKAQVDHIQAQSIQNKGVLDEKDPEIRAQKLDVVRQSGLDQDRHDAFIRRACMMDSVAAAQSTV